jgi:hypothetical protein
MAVPSLILFADAGAGFDWEFSALILGLVVLIAMGVGVTLKLRAQARSGDEPKMPEHSLVHYQKLLEQGLIDAQEYRRICVALGRQPKTPPTKS